MYPMLSVSNFVFLNYKVYALIFVTTYLLNMSFIADYSGTMLGASSTPGHLYLARYSAFTLCSLLVAFG